MEATATERVRPYGRVALRCAELPDLAATGRPVVGMCSTHDQGCCAGCPTLGCRFCSCRRDKEACSHGRTRSRSTSLPVLSDHDAMVLTDRVVAALREVTDD